MPGARLTAEKKSRLRLLWPLGWPLDALGAEFGVSPSTIRRAASKMGLPPRASVAGRPPTVTDQMKRRLRARWLERVPTRLIAVELGVTTITVRRHASAMGLSPRPLRVGESAFDQRMDRRLIELWNSGAPLRVLTQAFPTVHICTVYKRRKALGLPDRRGKARLAPSRQVAS